VWVIGGDDLGVWCGDLVSLCGIGKEVARGADGGCGGHESDGGGAQQRLSVDSMELLRGHAVGFALMEHTLLHESQPPLAQTHQPESAGGLVCTVLVCVVIAVSGSSITPGLAPLEPVHVQLAGEDGRGECPAVVVDVFLGWWRRVGVRAIVEVQSYLGPIRQFVHHQLVKAIVVSVRILEHAIECRRVLESLDDQIHSTMILSKIIGKVTSIHTP